MIKDLTGLRFGRLVVIGQSDVQLRTEQKMTWWSCRCDCGEEIVTGRAYLITGRTKSCGCLRREIATKRALLNHQRRKTDVNHA